MKSGAVKKEAEQLLNQTWWAYVNDIVSWRWFVD